MYADPAQDGLFLPPGYLWPPPMSVVEASFSGTFRTILVLSILWFVIRLFIRHGQRSTDGSATRAPRRPHGEVRLEDAPTRTEASGLRPNAVIIDADYEEVK